jgi:hypothetical protein
VLSAPLCQLGLLESVTLHFKDDYGSIKDIYFPIISYIVVMLVLVVHSAPTKGGRDLALDVSS